MKKKSAGSIAVMLLVMIYLLIPLVISIIYSLFKKWTGILPEGFSIGNYASLFSDPNFLAFGRYVYCADLIDDRYRLTGPVCNNDLFS